MAARRTIAFRVHLASGCFAAAACAALWWNARVLTGRAEAAFVAAAAFAVSREFWSQAIIADVYSLNVLLVFVALALALAYAHRPRPRLALGLVLVTALGLSSHWPLFLLASPCVLLPPLPVRRHLSADLGSRPLATAALLLAGLLPYVWLVFRSHTAPLQSFSGPIDSFGDFWTFVSRAGYSTLENNPNAGFSEKLGFLGFTAREALWQYTPAGAAIAAAGAIIQWRRTQAPLAAGLAIAFLGATVLLIALVRWDDDFLWRTVFSVYRLYRRIDRAVGAQATSTFGFNRALIDYVRRVADRRPLDRWTIDHRHLVFQQMGYALSGLVELGDQGYGSYRPDLERVSSEFPGLLGRLILLNRQDALSPGQLLAMVQKAEGLLDDTIKTSDRAALAGVRASVMSKMGKKD